MMDFLLFIGAMALGFIGGFFTHRQYFKPKVTINITEFKCTGNLPIFESTGEVHIQINSNSLKTE